jgi:hypothetical protein
MSVEQQFDQARAEAFAGRLLDNLNGGATMIMTSICVRGRNRRA